MESEQSLSNAGGSLNPGRITLMASKTFANIPKEKQDRVLRAAQIEFAENGYNKANINDICRRADISNGALYKYFKNKAELYRAVIKRQVEGKNEYMRGVRNADKRCIEKIRMLMQNTQTETEARNDTFRILLQIGTSDMNSFARTVTRRIESTSYENIHAILVEGVSRGEIRSDIDLDMTAFLINSICFSLYSGFVSAYHQVRLEEFFHTPFSADDIAEEPLVDRMMKWMRDYLAP
jgi:AcrR family transcriptional regulator